MFSKNNMVAALRSRFWILRGLDMQKQHQRPVQKNAVMDQGIALRMLKI
jgi:hypothetical protein